MISEINVFVSTLLVHVCKQEKGKGMVDKCCAGKTVASTPEQLRPHSASVFISSHCSPVHLKTNLPQGALASCTSERDKKKKSQRRL